MNETSSESASSRSAARAKDYAYHASNVPGAGGYADGRPTEPGIVRITVVEAEGYNPEGDSLRPYVVLKCGDKERKTSHRPRSTHSECSW